MKIAILNHTGCAMHVGCIAAMYVLERELTRRYGEGAIAHRVATHEETIGAAVADIDVCTPDTARGIARTLPYAKWFEEADLVILNGEGTLHWQDNRGNPRAWIWLALLELAAQFKCETWVVNTSLFSDSKAFLRLACDAMRPAVHIACRDGYSTDTLHRIGLSQTTRAADLTFLVPSTLTPEVGDSIASQHRLRLVPEKPILAAGSSAITPRNTQDWLAFFKPICRREKSNLLWFLQPHWHNDINLVACLTEKYGCMPTVDYPLAPAEMIWLMQRHRAVVSGRFHINTFAAISGVPALLLPGNTPKNLALEKQLAEKAYPFFGITERRRCKQWLHNTPQPGADVADKARRLAVLNFPGAIDNEEDSTRVDSEEYLRQTRFLEQYNSMNKE